MVCCQTAGQGCGPCCRLGATQAGGGRCWCAGGAGATGGGRHQTVTGGGGGGRAKGKTQASAAATHSLAKLRRTNRLGVAAQYRIQQSTRDNRHHTTKHNRHRQRQSALRPYSNPPRPSCCQTPSMHDTPLDTPQAPLTMGLWWPCGREKLSAAVTCISHTQHCAHVNPHPCPQISGSTH